MVTTFSALYNLEIDLGANFQCMVCYYIPNYTVLYCSYCMPIVIVTIYSALYRSEIELEANFK